MSSSCVFCVIETAKNKKNTNRLRAFPSKGKTFLNDLSQNHLAPHEVNPLKVKTSHEATGNVS